MIHRLRALRGRLEAQRAELAMSLLDQPPPDYASLQRMVGKGLGLLEAIAEIDQLLRGTDE